MSEANAESTVSHEALRPHTVLIRELRDETFDDNTSMGHAFFTRNNNNTGYAGITDNHNQILKVEENVEEVTCERGSSQKVRPTTVTKCHRTDSCQEHLVHVGASSSPKSNEEQTLSPKPKSENCYICGKEFLLSSLKIHEKQCAKKHENASKTDNNRFSKPATKKSIESKISKKPRQEACYLCGKEFFVHSLSIHETRCIKSWKANKTPDANDQRVSEKSKRENEFTNKNSFQTEDAKEEYCEIEKQQATVKSAKLETRQEKHSAKKKQNPNASPKFEKKLEQQSTKKKATQNASPEFKKKSGSPKQRELKAIPCNSCGAPFFQHSLKIHEKSCRGKTHSDSDSSINVDNARLHVVENAGLENTHLGDKEESRIGSGPQLSVHETVQSHNPERNISSKMPNTIDCYICGETFLKSLYAFHEKKCMRVSESSQTSKTDKCKENKASSPKSSMKPKTITCHICGKEFLKSSFSFHEKKCSNVVEKLQEAVPDVVKSNKVKDCLKPRTIICYVCGQEFLKTSYAIHEKQCGKNEKLNSEANNTWKGKLSIYSGIDRAQTPRRRAKTKACSICGNEILTSSFKVHEQQCQKKTELLKSINQMAATSPPSKKAGKPGVAGKTDVAGKCLAKPKTELCYICGQSFLLRFIKAHEVQCKKHWNEKNLDHNQYLA